MTTYTTTAAAKLAGIASSGVRQHTRNPLLIPYFSATATATDGKPRQLTTDDVRTLRFIADATRNGLTIADVSARLAAGELAAFDWYPLENQPDQDQEQTQTSPQDRALIDPTTTALMQLLRDQFDQTRANAERLQAQLIESEAQRLQLQTELDALKSRSFWSRLFGR